MMNALRILSIAAIGKEKKMRTRRKTTAEAASRSARRCVRFLLHVPLLLVLLGSPCSCSAFSTCLLPCRHHCPSSADPNHFQRTSPHDVVRLSMTTSTTPTTLPQHWNDTFVCNNGRNTNYNAKRLDNPSTFTATAVTTTTTLGDIMGLVTESDGLAAHYGIHHPLDRMALTANGNLQRLVSSFYDAPVSVVVDYCVARQDLVATDKKNVNQKSSSASSPSSSDLQSTPLSSSISSALRAWDRRVSLRIYGQTFCVATSVICVHDPQCVAAVESGSVGLGQLFRHLNVLPTFALQRAGKNGKSRAIDGNHETTAVATDCGGGGFWREYSLSCDQLSCDIHEEFIEGMWAMRPNSLQED